MPLPAQFQVVQHHRALDNGLELEKQWMHQAAEDGKAYAHLWQSSRGWVVPKSYLLRATEALLHKQGCFIRSSGGGLVPQGPGIWNLSLIWSVSQAFDLDINEIYLAMCLKIAVALKELGIYVSTGSTPGSFCDGKFNLSVHGQKLVGTAQSWKKINGTKVVLAHAVLLVDIEAEPLIQAANAVEESIGSKRRYLANSITSIAQECCFSGDIEMQTLSALTHQFSTQHLEISHGTS